VQSVKGNFVLRLTGDQRYGWPGVGVLVPQGRPDVGALAAFAVTAATMAACPSTLTGTGR
jgi:hypothetical protein